MKILVTGGAGFIGSHIVDKLLEQGHNVLIYDICGPRYGQDCENVLADVNHYEKLESCSKGYDAIYHLAAEANVNNFYNYPLVSNQNTAYSTLNVLESARKNNISRVLLASTEWVYGSIENGEGEVVTEETPVSLNPDHLYTSSKIAAELYCKNYLSLYGVNYTIMRYGIPFGERARPDTVTPLFIDKIKQGNEISIHGNGTQTRQFIYVEDLAEGNIACLKDEAANQVFNINGREVISVLNIVETLERKRKKKARVRFTENRKGNYRGRYISSEKAEKMLGWSPKHTYLEAMGRYIKNLA